MRIRYLISVALFFSTIQTCWAVNHIHPELFPNARHDDVHVPTTAQIRRFGSLRAAMLSSNTGTKNVAVILVNFANSAASCGSKPCTTGSPQIQNFSNVDSRFQQMAAYYNEVSFGKAQLNFRFFGSHYAIGGDTSAVVSGAITLSNAQEYYGCGDEGVGCPSNIPTATPGQVRDNGDYLIHDALAYLNTNGHNMPKSNSISGGTFDVVIVVHAGNGNETTTAIGDIWSIFYSQDASIIDGSLGSGFSEGDVDPDTESSGIISSLGVMCHEFGHAMGLPDEYNTATGESVVGNWELMDSGPYDGAGANPAHMNAWDKQYLGWATPQVVNSSSQTLSLGYIESQSNSSSMLKLPVTNGSPQEYFLVEYRSPSSGALFDQNIPGQGILIWHIDDGITSSRGVNGDNTVNTGNPHYGISLVTADGVTINSSNQGDSGNPFGNGQNFIPPQSNNFSGQPTGIDLVNISGVGSSKVSMNATNFVVGSSQVLLKAVNYPNPAGKGRLVSTGMDNQTVIQFQMSQPARDYSINLYTLSGGIVRKVSQSEINLNINRSGDNKWVYEYTWDLKNGDGNMVAPGVYFYLVRVDGNNKTGKIVVIR